MKRFLKLALLTFLCLTLAGWVVACGDDDTDTTATSEEAEPATTVSQTGTNGDDGADPFVALADIETTVTVTVNGDTTVIWSQKDDNWRWQNPKDPENYVIYNDDEKKLWVVDAKVAMESSEDSLGSPYWSMSPAGMLSMYTMLPGGSYSGDNYEINVPGKGKIVVEFEGPEGLPSKFSVLDDNGNEEESIIFEYDDVGNVADDLFILPADVSIQAMPDIPGGGAIPEF